MVVTAISAAFGHARTASISRPMPCAGFPWDTSLATTAPISRSAVEALRLVKDHLGARASRPHKNLQQDELETARTNFLMREENPVKAGSVLCLQGSGLG